MGIENNRKAFNCTKIGNEKSMANNLFAVLSNDEKRFAHCNSGLASCSACPKTGTVNKLNNLAMSGTPDSLKYMNRL